MHKKSVLNNGVRIVTEKLEHSRALSVGIWVNVGSRDEDVKENGISHFVEHMIFKGTSNRDSFQIAKELDAIGGLSNAFTGKEYTCFHSRVLDKHFPVLADILSDIFLNSRFESEDVSRERQVILQEISMVDDTPDEYIHELFNRLFWKEHALGMSVLGTTETVGAINRVTIQDFINRFYTSERVMIVAAGNVDHDEIVKFFSGLFESLPSSDFPSSNGVPEVHSSVLSSYKELEQVHVCLGGKAPHFRSKERFACAIFNTLLGGNMSSRLFQEVREKRGLAYSIYSFLSSFIDTGLFGIYVGTDPAHVNRVLSVINKEIVKIQDGAVTSEDLAGAKEHIIGGILLGAESTDSRMMRLAKNEYVFGKYISYDELVADLERVTIDEVVACAGHSFATDEVSLATLGPIKEDELDLDCMKFG